MTEEFGRVPTGQALVSDQAPAGLDPSGFDPSRDMQPVYDLIIETCQHNEFHARGASALRAINRLEAENGGLRIALRNVLRGAGVAQDMAIGIIREATGAGR